MEAEDRELVRLALDGDDAAFAKIVRRYERGLYNLALRMVRDPELARDLTQDVFIRVHRSLARYDPVYPFPSWIFRVASNLCIDWIRRRRIATVSLDASVPGEEASPARDVPAGEPDPEQALLLKDRARILGEALAKLPEAHRLVLLLRHQRDLSYEEIALALDVPLGTAKARIHRAREALRRILVEGHALEDLDT
jgi:RNA polymerase sigma-70 factor (ECF subfamily)